MAEGTRSDGVRRNFSEPGINEHPEGSVSCDICGKTYARVDHLVRHQRSHSDVKPFACNVCGKEFARVDVLKRHLTNHDDDAQAAKRRRKVVNDGKPRVAKACRACAAAKLKCEDDKPCVRCRQRQVQCLWSEPNPLMQADCFQQHEFNQSLNDRNSQLPMQQESPMNSFAYSDPHMTSIQSPSSATIDPNSGFLGSVSVLPSTMDVEAGATDPSLISDGNLQADPSMLDFSAGISPSLDESSLAYFLNGIMVPPMPDPETYNVPMNQSFQSRTPRDFLDFGIFNMDSFDIDMMSQQIRPKTTTLSNFDHSKPQPASGTQTPSFGDRIASGNAAFLRSVWMWTPTNQDFGGQDNLNLSLAPGDMDSPETRAVTSQFVHQHFLENAMRDKILGLVLSTCDSSLFPSIASSFPPADLLHKLMHFYMAVHVVQTDSWLHLPTLDLSECSLVLIVTMVTAGAVICSSPSIRKLGYALQEAVRTCLAVKFENDNSATRDLSTLQAFALNLQVGLWSGDKRKMELAESFAQPLITMLRRAGRFRRPKDQILKPTSEDTQDVLEMKWRQWAEAESYRRLACHLLIHDAQASMACQVAPLLTPTEFSLSFPSSRELWVATSAQQWMNVIHQNSFVLTDKGPSISQAITSVSHIREHSNIDLTFAAVLVIHSTWAIVHSNSLLNALTRSSSFSQKHHESPMDIYQNSGIVHLIEQVVLNLSDWEGSLKPELALVSERTLLNLHVSFEQVQLFAGKEGEEEARRSFPILQRWAESNEARKAIWHAGQILKAARRCSPKAMREFGAICVYHAGLTFWAYGVLLTVLPEKTQSQTTSTRVRPTTGETVWLDGDDVPAVQRFISLNRGTPVVCDDSIKQNGSVSPTNLKALMELCITLLRKQPGGISDNHNDLPLVENLSQLMRDLGNAAHGLLSGHLRRCN